MLMDSQKIIHTSSIFLFLWFNNSMSQCPLEFKNITTALNSTCEEGTWNDFLQDECCKEPFNIYLDALALRANQTGKIYLNATEQTSCLNKSKDDITDVSTCGFDKLTMTNGVKDCSGLMVQDVVSKLGDDVISLSTGCGLVDHGASGGWACGKCVKSWKEIKGTKGGDRDRDDDLCRFAVLTTLTSSRIDDLIWVRNVHRCLGDVINDFRVYAETSAQEKKKDTHEIIGLLSGILAFVLVCVYIIVRRCQKSRAKAKDATKRDLPKKSEYLKVPLKEIHYATNNLDQSNYIGEGTAGKH
ncbi:uncharacterized protein LOC143550731 [Bidens hawaiensis]|uniref:uncharacterized protein LOC143550731 n=1 Tax=Bidens hawaiensis TaxID=980011 RepID=UPI00404921D0